MDRAIEGPGAAAADASALRLGLLEGVLETSDIGVVIYDPQDRLAYCNPAFRKFHPQSEAALRVGRHRRDILKDFVAAGMGPPEGEASAGAWIERLVRERRRSWSHADQLLADGRWVRGSFRILPNGGLLVSQTDVTRDKQQEVALLMRCSEAERMNAGKAEFLSNMTHELRAPLNAILGFSELIEGEVNGPISDPRYRDYAASIRESGEYLLSIINDLLDMAKFNAGRTQIAEERVAIARTAAAVARMAESRARHAGIDFRVQLDPPVPDLLADERQLKQMLLNLVSNALKFTPPNGSVRVSGVLTEEGDYVLSVSDTGIGMAESDIPVALSPFGQIDSALGRGHRGTGLGLPLVKSMIEAHGGVLTLTSQPGKGTIATLVFPSRRVLPDMAAAAGDQSAK